MGQKPNFKQITILTEDGMMKVCDALVMDGHAWFVTEWLISEQRGLQRPARLVRLSGLPVQEPPEGSKQPHLLTTPVPRALFDLSTEPSSHTGFVILDNPDIAYHSERRH